MGDKVAAIHQAGQIVSRPFVHQHINADAREEVCYVSWMIVAGSLQVSIDRQTDDPIDRRASEFGQVG